MKTHEIQGVLHGEEKSISIKAANRSEAIDKVQSKYPDFEIDAKSLETVKEGHMLDTSVQDANLQIELLKKIEINTSYVATVAKIILTLLAILVGLIAIVFFISIGMALMSG